MRLNGWQRLGVIASAIWVPVGFFWGNAWWISTNGAPSIAALNLCQRLQTDWTKCDADFNDGYQAAIAGHWWVGLVLAVLIPLLAWSLAWIVVRLFRWVRAGFVQQDA